MIKRFNEARRNDEGFTLVELLVVIIVLGILAGIAVFGVATFQKDAKSAACKADVKIVSTATDAYYAKNLSYKDTAGAAITTTTLKDGGYIKEIPGTTVAIDGTTGEVTPSPAC